LAGEHPLRLLGRFEIGIYGEGIQRIGPLAPIPLQASGGAASPFAFFSLAFLHPHPFPGHRLLNRLHQGVALGAEGIAMAGDTLLAFSMIQDRIGGEFCERG